MRAIRTEVPSLLADLSSVFGCHFPPLLGSDDAGLSQILFHNKATSRGFRHRVKIFSDAQLQGAHRLSNPRSRRRLKQ
jgi:hypothetical protein